MKIPPVFGFYAILTNPMVGYGRLTGILVKHNVSFVQLRMKGASKNEIYRTARAVRSITAGSATRFIINDDPRLAADVGADGVHLGQSDMPYADARAIVGEGAIIGLSTHSVEQVTAACKFRPDYIGTGPVFATPTKKVPDPVIGIDGLSKMINAADVPAVAIGGINEANLEDVLKAGACNFSLVRPINEARNPEDVLLRILDIYRKTMTALNR